MKKILPMLAAAAVTGASCLSMSAETVYVNETSKVGTSQDAWHATGTPGGANAKQVTPLGGTSVTIRERYFNNSGSWGESVNMLTENFTPLYQTITGLQAGTYKAAFYVSAHNANNAGGTLAADNETANVAYVKIGDNEVTKTFKSIVNKDLTADEPFLVTFDNLNLAEGQDLTMGIKVIEAKATNWYTIQISSLQRVATDDEALTTEIATLNGYKETLNALVAKYPYASSTTLGALQTLIAKTESVDTTSLAAVSALNTEIAAYLDNASNERKLAEEDAVLASLNATPITIVNPNADQPEAQDTAWKWYKGGSSDFSQKSAENNRPTLSDGTTINTYFDGWDDSQNWRFGVQQNVELEPGEYRLSVMYRAGGLLKYFRLIAAPDHDAAERLGYFEKDNDSDVTDPHTNLSKITGGAGEVFGNGWAIDHLDFKIEEPTAPASDMYKEEAAKKNVCIAAMAATWSKAEKSSSARWASFTHFQLVKKPKDIGSGISGTVVEDVNAPVEYFDLNGIRVNADNLKKGIYIKRQGNKVTKIIK